MSSTKPGPNSPIASQSRATASSSRAIALPPPAVFSMSSGTPKPPSSAWRAKVFRQLSTPTAGSSFASTWPPCATSPSAPTAAAALACAASSLRLGIRMRLFVVATLSTYGAWTTTATPDARSRSASARGRGGLPALRIGQEDLDGVRAHVGCPFQGINGVRDGAGVVLLRSAGAHVYADRVSGHAERA